MTRPKKRASLKQRLAVLAVMLGIAVPLALIQAAQSDRRYAEDLIHALYRGSDIIEIVRGKGIFPGQMTAYCQNHEYGFVFVQEFTRDGTEWYMQEDTAACFEKMHAGRRTTERCIAEIGETDISYFIICDPLAASGFFAVTDRTEPEALQSLYDAIQPAAELQHIPFCAVSSPAGFRMLKHADFPALRHAQFDTPLHGGLPELPALFRLLGVTLTEAADGENLIHTIIYDAQNDAPIYHTYSAEYPHKGD